MTFSVRQCYWKRNVSLRSSPSFMKICQLLYLFQVTQRNFFRDRQRRPQNESKMIVNLYFRSFETGFLLDILRSYTLFGRAAKILRFYTAKIAKVGLRMKVKIFSVKITIFGGHILSNKKIVANYFFFYELFAILRKKF